MIEYDWVDRFDAYLNHNPLVRVGILVVIANVLLAVAWWFA